MGGAVGGWENVFQRVLLADERPSPAGVLHPAGLLRAGPPVKVCTDSKERRP